MSDTKPLHATAASSGPTEGDGISYRGIVWFVVILAVTTLVCQGLMWLMFDIEQSRAAATDVARAPLAAPAGTRPPQPNLLTLEPEMPLGEPSNLQRFREHEDAVLTTYGWVDQNAGTVRIPIDRAKALVLERGLPTRSK